MATQPPPVILIVEDIDTCSSTLEIALSSMEGCQVLSVNSAEDALAVVAGSTLLALVTDLHLPGMSGFELIRHVRSVPGTRPPIIVVSGDTDPHTPHRAHELGADAYFAKPYSPAEVRRTLERLIHVP